MSQKKLTKRTDGRFKVNYGNKQFYGKTKAEAIRKRDAFIAEAESGIIHDFATCSFLDYGMRWVRAARGSCNEAQRNQYVGIIRFVDAHLPVDVMKDITWAEIQPLCDALHSYSASYVNKFMSTLRSIFKAAVSEGAITRNPMDNVRRPKCKKTVGHRALQQWERDLITSTYAEHDFGLAALLMFYTGLRRGQALYIDVDRDVDFINKTITVRGAVSFQAGNQPLVTAGKTDNAERTVPLVPALEKALQGRHGLLCSKTDGQLMSESAFDRKYDSYITFLETKLNKCVKRWYGKTREQKKLLAQGVELPPWQNVTIRCHDFRVDYCTRCYYAGVDIKTLQKWMGHASAELILKVYTKLSQVKEDKDAAKLCRYTECEDATET